MTFSKNDKATKLYKQIYNIIGNKYRRTKTPTCKSGNARLKNDLDAFTVTGNEWKDNVKSGEKSEEEFLYWLKSIKEGVLNGEHS